MISIDLPLDLFLGRSARGGARYVDHWTSRSGWCDAWRLCAVLRSYWSIGCNRTAPLGLFSCEGWPSNSRGSVCADWFLLVVPADAGHRVNMSDCSALGLSRAPTILSPFPPFGALFGGYITMAPAFIAPIIFFAIVMSNMTCAMFSTSLSPMTPMMVFHSVAMTGPIE